VKTEEEESESQERSSDSRPKKKGPKKKRHNHIGPNVRAYRVGRAFCPMCDAEKILRLTPEEREAEKVAKEAVKAGRK
jgi:lipid A disaccharide synthetase